MAADSPLSMIEEKLGIVVYWDRWESMSDLIPATLEERAAGAPVIADPTAEATLEAPERASEAMLLAAEPGLTMIEVAASNLVLASLTTELKAPAADVRAPMLLGGWLDIFLA